MCDRDKCNVTQFINIINLDKTMLELYNVTMEHKNTSNDSLKKILYQHLDRYKTIIDIIYEDDIKFLEYINKKQLISKNKSDINVL